MVVINKDDRRGRGRKKIAEKTKDDICRMYKQGLPISTIEEKHGISRSTVYRVLRERTVRDE